MKTYYIQTDAGQIEISAKNVKEALIAFGAPATTAKGFEKWLKKVGGFGRIEENGNEIARVR